MCRRIQLATVSFLRTTCGPRCECCNLDSFTRPWKLVRLLVCTTAELVSRSLSTPYLGCFSTRQRPLCYPWGSHAHLKQKFQKHFLPTSNFMVCVVKLRKESSSKIFSKGKKCPDTGSLKSSLDRTLLVTQQMWSTLKYYHICPPKQEAPLRSPAKIIVSGLSYKHWIFLLKCSLS